MKRIRITVGSVVAEAELNATRTAQAIWDGLPVTSRAQTWGEEIYFTIPEKTALENGQEVVALGDLAYWPPGKAFCIFFGATPISQGAEIRPAGKVTVIGKLRGNAKAFRQAADDDPVVIEKLEQ